MQKKDTKKPNIAETTKQIYQEKGEVKEALDKLKKLHPKDDKQQFEEIVNEVFLILSSACNKDAKYSKAFATRAKVYYHMGDFHRALIDMSTAIHLEDTQEKNKQNLADYHNFCVVLLFEIGTMQDAIHHAELASHYAKNEPSMQGINLFNKGLILSNVGKVDKAMEAFSKSQELIEAGDHEK